MDFLLTIHCYHSKANLEIQHRSSRFWGMKMWDEVPISGKNSINHVEHVKRLSQAEVFIVLHTLVCKMYNWKMLPCEPYVLEHSFLHLYKIFSSL